MRRAATLIEIIAILFCTVLLLPTLGVIGAALMRGDGSATAEARVQSLRQGARELRGCVAAGWRVDGDVLVAGGSRWSNGEDGVERDGALRLRGCALSWHLRDDGWLVLRLTAPGSEPRLIVAPPAERP